MLQIRVYKKRKSLIHVLVNDKPQRNIYTEHNICVCDFGTILMIRKICFQSSVVYLGTISEFLFCVLCCCFWCCCCRVNNQSQ